MAPVLPGLFVFKAFPQSAEPKRKERKNALKKKSAASYKRNHHFTQRADILYKQCVSYGDGRQPFSEALTIRGRGECV